MSGLRRTWTRRTAQLTAAGLLAASGSMFFASTALAAAGGNNGTVQINGDLITNGNDPHITCPIIFKWSGFDPGVQDDYTITATPINPTGGTSANVTTTVAGTSNPGHFTGPDYTLNGVQIQVIGGTANKKGEFHVNLTVETKSAHSTDTKSKTVWLANCTPPPPPPSNLSVSGQCSPNAAGTILWTVTNPNATDATNVAAVPPAGVTPSALSSTTVTGNGGTATFTTPAPLPNNTTMGASGTVNGQSVSSNAAGFSATCVNIGAPEVPATVTFSDDCSGTTANFTSADQHTSVFTVTDPFGASSTQTGSGSKHYNANAGHKHTAITDDKGGTYSHDWVDPGNCNPGHAAPVVTEANHCASGMNLTLSNMNGTAPATFTVVDPDGNVQTVTVNAGQLKKLVFAVKEDTTGTVSVTATGGAKQQFIYKKNCATVLGVKHTRKPPHKPVVKGEHQQLPFTGFDTKRALLDGSVVLFLGAVLCIMGARRQEEEPLYY